MQREVVTDRDAIKAVDAAKQWIVHDIAGALEFCGVGVDDNRDAYRVADYVFGEIRLHLEDIARGD